VNLESSQGGLFSDPEFSCLKQQPLSRYFESSEGIITFEIPRSKVCPLLSDLETDSIVYTFVGDTYYPFSIQILDRSRDTYLGVSFLTSLNLDGKIPPTYYFREMKGCFYDE
jgi:hypothetical protein